MRVYFDASVIIAALLSPTGGSALLFFLVKNQHIVGITSQTVIKEVFSKTEKIGTSIKEIEEFITDSKLLIRVELTTEDVARYTNIVEAEDRPVVAGAVLTKCEYLATLDKRHLLNSSVQTRIAEVIIANPKNILEEWKKSLYTY